MTRSNGFLRSLQNLCCWMLLGIGLLSGCKTLTVDSVPPGADVIIDGGVSGFKTPWRFDARSFGTGTHTISVSMRDFKSLTPEYKIEAFVSGGKIAGAILLPVPCLFVGMRTGF